MPSTDPISVEPTGSGFPQYLLRHESERSLHPRSLVDPCYRLLRHFDCYRGENSKLEPQIIFFNFLVNNLAISCWNHTLSQWQRQQPDDSKNPTGVQCRHLFLNDKKARTDPLLASFQICSNAATANILLPGRSPEFRILRICQNTRFTTFTISL